MLYPDVLSITCIPQSKSTYKATQVYQQLGLSVIPLKGKRPALSSWSRFQLESAPPEIINQWKEAGLPAAPSKSMTANPPDTAPHTMPTL